MLNMMMVMIIMIMMMIMMIMMLMMIMIRTVPNVLPSHGERGGEVSCVSSCWEEEKKVNLHHY